MIILKNDSEIARIRKAGRIIAKVLRECAEAIEPHRTTPVALSLLAERIILQEGGFPAFKGYKGYPATLCVSVNEQVVHAIPDNRPIRPGDVVGLDTGVFYQGYCADAAISVAIGKVPEPIQRLLQATEESLWKAIETCKPGKTTGDVGHAIQQHVERFGFKVAKSLAGHGVGRAVHEYPDVPNDGNSGEGHELRPGMTLAIEPMVCFGKPDIEILSDGWTIITTDKRYSAHFEHTVAITQHGAEVLTLET
jgi:methionyl aminopeptidase